MDELWEHVGFIPVPAGPRGRPASVAGSMSYAIFRQSAQPQLAMRVLESAVAPEALARLAQATGRVPARRSAVELAAPDLPFLSQSAEILGSAVTRPHIPLYPRVSQAAAVDARGGADRASRPRGGGEARRRPDRGDHRAADRPGHAGVTGVTGRCSLPRGRRRPPLAWRRRRPARTRCRRQHRRCHLRRTSRARRRPRRAARSTDAHATTSPAGAIARNRQGSRSTLLPFDRSNSGRGPLTSVAIIWYTRATNRVVDAEEGS